MNQPAGKREIKRAALKQKLIDVAYKHIRTNGLSNLRAREITSEAGCALGALYNVFEDIDTLILHVNSITLNDLGDKLAEIGDEASAPEDKLVALAIGYLDFACENYNLWAALFDHRMPDGVSVPDWHLKEHFVLFQHIAMPVHAMMPEAPEEDVQALSKALFATVHGIVSLSLQERFIAVPRADLSRQLQQIVAALVKGLA